MKFSIITVSFALLVVSSVSAQRDDKRKAVAGEIVTPVEGVVYALPLTGIRLHVTATRERFVQGPFSMYAQKMLGVDNFLQADGDRWNIDQMKIELFSEPDPEQVYKAMGPSAHMVSLTESGILAGIYSDSYQEKVALQTSSFLMKKPDKQTRFTDLSLWSYYSAVDSTSRSRMVSKTQEQKAAEAAETIFNLRNSRFSLLTNADDEPLPDGKAFEVMAQELGAMEENYVALFIGKSEKQTHEFSFDFVPGSKNVKSEVFFRFSDDLGVLPKTDLSGRPIVIEVIKAEVLASKQNSLIASNNPAAGKSGLYYRMPGIAEIRIMDGSNQLATARAAIAQFGAIAPIPEDILDGNYKLQFYPNTGAVKSITPNP